MVFWKVTIESISGKARNKQGYSTVFGHSKKALHLGQVFARDKARVFPNRLGLVKLLEFFLHEH